MVEPAQAGRAFRAGIARLELPALGDAHQFLVQLVIGGRNDVEIRRLALGNLVKLAFQIAGEIQFHEGEASLHQIVHDQLAGFRRDEVALFLGQIAAIHHVAHDGRVSRRTADALGFQLGNQARLRVPLRRHRLLAQNLAGVGPLIGPDIEHGHLARVLGFAVGLVVGVGVFDRIFRGQDAPTGFNEHAALGLELERRRAVRRFQRDRVHLVAGIGQLRGNRALPYEAIQGALLVVLAGFFDFDMLRPDGFVGFLGVPLRLEAARRIRQLPALALGIGPDFGNGVIAEIHAVGANVGDRALLKELLRELRGHFGIELERHTCRLQ